MTVILPPTPGEGVQILAPSEARLIGQVTRREPDPLTPVRGRVVQAAALSARHSASLVVA